jgi:hypothetical protein
VAGNQVTAGTQTVTVTAPVANLTVNGGSGNNQLTVSALTVPVHNVTLVGGAGTTTYTVNAGTVNIVAGTGVNVLNVTGGTVSSITAPAGDTQPLVFAHSYTVLDNGILSVPASGVLVKDVSANGQALTAVLASGPGHGTLSLNADGSFTYTPVANFVGTDSFTYQAKGSDGTLSTAAPVTIQVIYHFSGFLAPLNSTLAMALNRTIPIKFQLTDYNGAFISSLGAVTSLQVLNAQGTNVLTNPGSTSLRYDPTANQFITNWQTKGLAAGTYTVVLALADGTAYQTVLSAQQETSVIGNQVNNLVNQGLLSSGNGTALAATLNSATASLNGGHTNAAVDQLKAFINQVNAFVMSGTLTSAQGQGLTSAAKAAITAALGPGSFQLSSGASTDFVSSYSNQILNGVLTVSAEDDTGNGLDPSAVARLNDAMGYLNSALGSFGVYLSWAAAGTNADVHIHFASTTPEGSASDGVLGFTTPDNNVYFVTGWSLYTGPDPSGIGAAQYDFLTLATHELAHTVGLGESIDPNSVMYEYLPTGSVRRTFTDANLALINTDADRFMKVGGAPLDAVNKDARTGPHAPLPDSGSYLGVSVWFGVDLGNRSPATEPFTGLGRILDPGLGAAAPAPFANPPAASAFYQGNGGDAILLGGAGNDVLLGGRGRDILVGGFATDPADVTAVLTALPADRAAAGHFAVPGDQTLPNRSSAQPIEEGPVVSLAPRALGPVSEEAVDQVFFEMDPEASSPDGLAGLGSAGLALGLALLLEGVMYPAADGREGSGDRHDTAAGES